MAATLSPPALPTDQAPSVFQLAAERLRPAKQSAMRLAWLATARPTQLPPEGDEWEVWFILAGRGFGKTRSGAEHTVQFARDHPDSEIGVIGRTDAEARRLLLRGPSGILACCGPDDLDPSFGAGKGYVDSPGDTRVKFANGATIYVAGANSPDALRGLNLWMAWCDELAAWRYQQTVWDDVLDPAVRKGPHPHILVTTTPRPTRLVRSLLKDVGTVVVRGSTFDNAANLAQSFIKRMRRKYEGTRSGRQELYAEVLDDVPGALLTREQLDDSRYEPGFDRDGTPLFTGIKLDGLYREAVVALDPSDGVEEGDEQAIALVGLGYDHDLYIEHTVGMKESVTEYLGAAVDLAVKHGATIVVEKNHGGRYLIATLDQVLREKDVVVPVRIVTASDGKRVRAEPIVPLFTRNKAHMVGSHPDVEDQLCSWVGAAGEKSPDQMDAVVWGMSHFLGHSLAASQDTDDSAYAYVQSADRGDWSEDTDDESVYDYG